MSTSLNNIEDHESHPARSGTPAAWMALGLFALLLLCVFCFDTIISAGLRLGIGLVAWNHQAELSIDHLELRNNRTLRAQGVTIYFGPRDQRSSCKIDSIEMQIASPATLLGFSKTRKNRFFREIAIGKARLFIDQRRVRAEEFGNGGKQRRQYSIPWTSLLPDAAFIGPLDLVVIDNNSRCAVDGLYLTLPDRWVGRMVYSKILLDLGSAHRSFSGASSSASWNGSSFRLGKLELAKDLNLEELTLSPQQDRLEFGVRGTIGSGLLRGDGAFFKDEDKVGLAVTLVGENLKMEALSMLVKEENQRVSGTIRQGRFTFRGNPERPLEADSSLRLVADNFRWQGRGWDSLRLAATLTGRSLTLSQLVLHQKENEVVAQGESKLPEKWREALTAPFTASFHAQLDDAGALAALVGPDFAQLSGGLELEGVFKGAENKAEGYCNLVSSGMKIRNLPIDSLKGCLLFEGKKTRLSNLEVWSGKDRIVLEGFVENKQPHTYAATAQFGIGNLTKSLAQIGIVTASQIGGGAVQGTWTGDGSSQGHSGSFQAKLNSWVSPWTRAGMSGSFEGSYSPGHLYCSKAQLLAQDLKLDFQLSASPTRLEAKSIVATRGEKADPLVQGDALLPVDAPALWQSGQIVPNLVMKDALAMHLELHGIKMEELALLLGQKTPCTGILEGKFAVGGTPESPEIHSALKIAKLTMPGDKSSFGLNWNFDSTGGRANWQIVQEPLKNTPLMLQAEMPFRLVVEKGGIALADEPGSLHATATLHNFSTMGWLSLWNDCPWTSEGGTLDGSIELGGSLKNPTAEGKLLFSANEIRVMGIPMLSDLKLPIVCSASKTSVSSGSAVSGTNPVVLDGVLDWGSIPTVAHLELTGKSLEFPKVAGMESRGDAAISLSSQGTNPPILSGKLVINNIIGNFPTEATPVFTPPGLIIPKTKLFFPPAEKPSAIQLNLEAKTQDGLSLKQPNRREPIQIKADFRIQGEVNAPHWSGTIAAENAEINFPSGIFATHESKLQSDGQGEERFSYKSYGLTRYGFCTLQQNDPLQGPWIESIPSSSKITEADIVLAMMTPDKSGCPPIAQLPYWIRQNTLFPLPPLRWTNHYQENGSGGTLGFFGRPWAITIQSSGNPSLPPDKTSSKN